MGSIGSNFLLFLVSGNFSLSLLWCQVKKQSGHIISAKRIVTILACSGRMRH